jgi:hypothetical protein
MTKFNPQNQETLIYAECLGPAMEITDKEDADQYLAAYIDFIQAFLDKDPHKGGKTAEEIAKENLGYYAGYYNSETMQRVNELFLTKHPIFD